MAVEGTPKLAIFSPTIARCSPFGGIRKGTTLPALRAHAVLWRRRVCCRIGWMLRTRRLLGDHAKGTEGSNLNLSATQSALQRNPAAIPAKSREMGAILEILLSDRTGESVPLSSPGKLCGLFL